MCLHYITLLFSQLSRLITKTLTVALGLSVCGISSYLVYLLLKKDDDDDYNDTTNHTSKFNTLEVRVPKDMLKVLIGRSGNNIKLIQEQSNSRISFREPEGQKHAICVIRGSLEACNIAENLVQDFLSNQPVVESEDIFVSQQFISRIIGRDGDRIREVSAMSGAKVIVDNNRAAVTRRITIKGKIKS